MLTTLSVLSFDQGKLRPVNETEDDYFARLATAETTAKSRGRFATLCWVLLVWRKPELAVRV